jgi:hypothetical protein
MSGIWMPRSHCSSLRLQLVGTPRCSRFALCKFALHQPFQLVMIDTDHDQAIGSYRSSSSKQQ